MNERSVTFSSQNFLAPDRVEMIRQYGMEETEVVIRFKTNPQMIGISENDITTAERDGRLVLLIIDKEKSNER